MSELKTSQIKFKIVNIKTEGLSTKGGKSMEGVELVYIDDAGEEKTQKLFAGFRSYIKLEDILPTMQVGEWWEVTRDETTEYKDWIAAVKLDAEPPKRTPEPKKGKGQWGGGSSWYGSDKHIAFELKKQKIQQDSIERQHAITKAVDILISGKKVDLKEVAEIADAILKSYPVKKDDLPLLKDPLDQEDKPFTKKEG